VTSSTPGIVAAGHPAAADAAAGVLVDGGNAFDAVVAAGFASCVCEPGFTSLAGGGHLLARTADGRDRLFDFFVDTPGRGRPGPAPEPVFVEVGVSFGAAHQSFHCGPGSVAVPGTLAGLLHVHAELGSLPLARVVEAAVALATDGVEVSPTQAHAFGLLEPILARTEASRAIFLPEGRLLAEGDRLHNPDLGGYLRDLAADPSRSFYRGAGASRFADQSARGGGLLTVDDLVGYQVIEREPLRFRYRDRTVVTNPPPTFGGSLLALALHRYERLGPPPAVASPERAERLRAVLAGIDRDRRHGHPEVVEALAGRLPAPARVEAVPSGGSHPDPPPVVTRGTTHVTVADGHGNVAAMTSSNGECSGDLIDGTGICCNNMLGEDDLHPDGFHAAPPGIRVGSMMSPTFVLDQHGRVDLALGSGGSKRIRSALLQVITDVVDHDRPLAEAVAAPRIHWDTDHTEAEPGHAPEVIERLEAHAPVNRWPLPSMYFGGVHAVEPGRGGAGDPRRGGSVRTVG
jgi:gamma-glutamyltranspeptidase/glutathione hydrolase